MRRRILTARIWRALARAEWFCVLVAMALCAGHNLGAQVAPATDTSQTSKGSVLTRGIVARQPYEPITASERLRWALHGTVGAESLMAGVFSAGVGTGRDDPPEFGPSWAGFGRRYGVRLSGIAAQNVMEASLGSIWGEDPRYPRLGGAPFETRVWNVFKFTFAARYRDGGDRPAYARLAAISGSNALTNAWRAESETHASDTAFRVVLGVLGRMTSNAFAEFWPDVRNRIGTHRGDDH